MHPQLQFKGLEHEHHHQGKVAGRTKRYTMPEIKFVAPDLEKDGDFWENAGQDFLKIQLQKNILNKNVAKNIIMFLGDGLSIPTIAATRIYMGGEEKQLPFELFPYSGLSKVSKHFILICLSL